MLSGLAASLGLLGTLALKKKQLVAKWRGNQRFRRWTWWLLLPLFFVFSYLLAAPGSNDPMFQNGDFELGNFSHWEQGFGSNPGLGGSAPFTEQDIKINPGGKLLQSVVGAGLDPRAPHLVLARQGNYAAKINDESNAAHLNFIKQKGTIREVDRDPTDGKLHVRFSYAAVLEDPGHNAKDQPYFHVYLKDTTTGQTLYDDFAYANQPGRVFYTTRPPSGSKWVSTPFIDVDIVVPDSSLGNQLEIRVLGADCSLGGHGGYVYVDAFGSLAIPPQGACVNDLVARGKPGNIQLTWSDTGAAAYAVYRSEALQGPFVKLGETQSRFSTYLDRTVAEDKPYYYVVRALDVDGHEVCSSGEVISVAPKHWSPGDAINRAPHFTSQPIKTGDVRAPYTYAPQVHDEDGDKLLFKLNYGPVGMTVDPATGVLNWQPTVTGDFRVNLQVSDGYGLEASQAFAISVHDSNQPPTITNVFPSRIPAGKDFSFQIQATDPDKDTLIYTIGSQATGVDISQTGMVTWKDPQPGRYPITIVVADPHNARVTQQVVVSVEAFPEFTSTPIVSATVGETYRYQAKATDRDGDPLTFAVDQGPVGMVVDPASGVVTWQPNAAAVGTHSIKLAAADPNGNTGYQTFTLRVTTSPNRAPTFTSVPVTFVAYPNTYSYSAAANDPDGDNLIWRLVSGPQGMVISTTGRVTWTFDNSVQGSFPVSIEVSDQRGGVVTQDYQLKVAVFGNSPPVISSNPTSQVRAGSPYSYSVSATDADRDALSYAIVNGPSAASFASNVLTWATTAADVGVHDFQISVTDTAGNTVMQTWQVEVIPASGNAPPAITSTPTVTATAGGNYSYQVVATDADRDALNYVLTDAPVGMTINATTGLISWAVPAGTAGSFNVAIEVSDGKGGVAQQNYAIGVGITANRPPLITSTPNATATAGSTYVYQVTATDPDNDALTMSLHAPDPTMTLSSTGKVEWAIPAGTTGTFEITVVVADGKGGEALQTFELAVGQNGNRPPRITSQPGVTTTPGAAYSYQINATDPENDPLNYQILTGPAAMMVSATGKVEWNVPANIAGLTPVSLKVSDGKGGEVIQTFDISVSGTGNRAPRITSTPGTSATVGAIYTYQVSANDPDGDALTYHLTQQPAGMTISATGRIEWTPAAGVAGTQAIQVVVRDSKGASAVQNYTLYVQQSNNRPPRISSVPSYKASPGVVYSYQVIGTDPDGDVLNYSITKGPVDMTMATNGLLMWLNPVLGEHDIEVRATDPRGAYATQTYKLRVALNNPPTITSTPITSATIGRPYSYQVTANDPDGDYLTYALTGQPAGVSISSTGLISGTATTVGTHNMVVTVSDGQASVQQVFRLSVKEPSTAAFNATIQATPRYINVGETTTIQVIPEGGTAPYTITGVSVGGRGVTLDANNQHVFTATAMGRQAMRATVRDSKGKTVTLDDWFGVKDPSDTTKPLAQITAPVSSDNINVATIAKPTDVIGTASDANLAEYKLMMSPAGKEQWTTIAKGTSSITNAKLGNVQTQTIANGLYDIGLIVTDTSGQEASARITVAIEGEQKTAPLALSFEDISLEVEGLPLKVTRSYDSLKRMQDLDFGFGWTVNYQDIWLQTNGELGRSWTFEQVGSGFNRQMCARPSGTRVASVRLPGGQLEQFELNGECVPVLQWVGSMSINVKFTPKSTNKSGSTLEALNYGDLRIAGGALFDMDMTETFNPSQFKLTTLDGTEYYLRKDFGVEQIKDRHGNFLQFTNNGITHSGGWALRFTRDATGRISSITKPDGKTLHYNYDPEGNLTEMVDAGGAISTYTYENPAVPHGLSNYTDPLGRLQLKTEYDNEGRVIRQTDADGKAVTITTDTANKRQTVKDRRGYTTVYDFDDRGNVTQVTDAKGGITKYAYDANDNEKEVIDPLGRKTTRTFDAYGNVKTETDPLGRTATIDYNAKGEVREMLDANGRQTVNGYDQSGDLTSITDHSGAAIALGYVPSSGNLASLKDALGNQIRYSYKKINGTTLKETETAADGSLTSYGYDNDGRIKSTTHNTVLKPGAAAVDTTSAQTYDPQGNMLTSTDASGHTTTYTYNAANEMLTETDPLGRLTKHEYSPRGERIKTTHPDGGIETWGFDNNGNETQHCVRNACTKQDYDELERVVKTTDALGKETITVYDPAGQVLSVKDARGKVTLFQYDDVGRQTIVTNALTQDSEQKYDAAGNVETSKDAKGQITTFGYDLMGRRTSVTFANGSKSLVGFNAAGQRISETDATGFVTTFGYDPMGRLAKVTDALNKNTTFTWNSLGQLLTQTDALGRVTGYGYDAAGRRVERKLPGGAQEKLVYDPAGQLISRVDFDGTTTGYEYDAGFLSKVFRTDGTQTIGYDSWKNPSNWTDTANGSMNRNYNAAAQVTSETTNHSVDFGAGATGFSSNVTYRWDENGNRLEVKDNTQSQTTLASYDALNRLETVTQQGGGLTTFGYDLAGNRDLVKRPDGSTTEYRHNAANQVEGVTHRKADGSVLAQFDYTLDAVGRRKVVVETITAASPVKRTVSYDYDATGKLKRETIAQTLPSTMNLVIEYDHDDVGNRTKRTVSGDTSRTTTYEYDANDRLSKMTDSVDGVTTYGWDARGNLISKTHGGNTTTYTWRSDNRLLSISNASAKIFYGYNPQGQRIKRYVVKGGVTTKTHYTLDTQRPYSEVLSEVTQVGSGAWTSQHNVFTPEGLGDLLQSGGQTTFADAQGNTRLVVDAAGNATALSYDAFGLEIGSATTSVNHRYTGEYFDQDSGLYHLRARDYDPVIGRFISMDEHPGVQYIPLSLNKYLYVNSDPANHIDPSGNIGLGGMMSAGINISLSYARMTAADFIMDRAVTSLVDKIVSGYKGARPIMPGGNISLNGLIQTIATQCSMSKKACLVKSVPILSTGSDLKSHAYHIAASQYGFSNTMSGAGVTSSVLVRGPSVGSKGRKWLDDIGCKKRGSACDEYPFASTLNGGEMNWHNDTVSTAPLPIDDSKRQMIVMGKFYSKSGIGSKIGKPFISVGNGFIRSYLIKEKKVTFL